MTAIFSCTKKTATENTDVIAATPTPTPEPSPTPTPTPTPTPSPTPVPDYLYVAAGTCKAGPNTAFTNITASNLVYRLNLSTGQKDMALADYNAFPSNIGDSPVGIADGPNDDLYILVENATTVGLRRIEKIPKAQSTVRTPFSSNITALSAVVRELFLMPSGDLVVTKATGIEYITAGNSRIGAPYGNPSAAPCLTSNTAIMGTHVLANGKMLFLHAAASQNRIGVLPNAGGTTCLAAETAPNANAYPVASVFDETNSKWIVAYAGTAATTDLNSIYSYDVNVTSGAISNPQKIYDASLFPAPYTYYLFSISAMALDAERGHIYISTAINNVTPIQNYQIEKFTYNPAKIGVDNPGVLTKQSTTFYPYGADTRCISQMIISD